MNNMNEDQNDINIAPYRASGNLNTVISNPSANINDTMNVNIQNLATNNMTNVEPNPKTDQNLVPPVSSTISKENINTPNTSIQNDTKLANNNSIPKSEPMVKKTYVNNENKPKKKKLTLNLGPEFKIALLIIVILMVFVLFILPIITGI